MNQLSLFEANPETEVLKQPGQYYIHFSTGPCFDNKESLCCVDCRRLGMKAKECDPCPNTDPAKCKNAKLIKEEVSL